MGQGLEVVPALGESYAGRTAQTIAALLLLLAEEARTAAPRRRAATARLQALLEAAAVADPELAALCRRAAEPALRDAADGEDLVLAAFARLHAHADAQDPALAAACRSALADWAEAGLLAPPAAG